MREKVLEKEGDDGFLLYSSLLLFRLPTGHGDHHLCPSPPIVAKVLVIVRRCVSVCVCMFGAKKREREGEMSKHPRRDIFMSMALLCQGGINICLQ